MAGFCATRSRRIQVLYGMVVHVIRCNTHYFTDNRRLDNADLGRIGVSGQTSRRRAGTGEHGGQDADVGRLRAGWRRLHRRRGCAACRWDGLRYRLRSQAPSTLGTFLRSFRWGHVRQLDRVSRQLLARAWAAGAGPGDSPLTIDLDSTICETSRLT